MIWTIARLKAMSQTRSHIDEDTRTIDPHGDRPRAPGDRFSSFYAWKFDADRLDTPVKVISIKPVLVALVVASAAPVSLM
jgi:hypothetical protein